MKRFNPLFPEISLPKIMVTSPEQEWRLRKNEIKNMILKFIRQREVAYKTYDKLTIERALTIALVKTKLNHSDKLFSQKYIKEILDIIENCSLLLPDQNANIWLTRFETIKQYCYAFLNKTNQLIMS